MLAATVRFPHRGQELADRVEAHRAVAYRIHLDTQRDRWYVDASWKFPATQTIPMQAALAHGVIGVDMNDDHLAAWHLDRHGNPVGEPRRFHYDLSGTADHRDAQIRHTLTRLLHWARDRGATAIAIENLDFAQEKTREKHGRRTQFRRLLSRFPTARLRARLVSMATAHGVAVIAVDPAYTSRWGAQHWQKPLTTPQRQTTRHDAASVAIGRRALGHPIRRRTAPPPHDQSDHAGHRTVQAGPDALGAGGNPPDSHRNTDTIRAPDENANAGTQHIQHRSGYAQRSAVDPKPTPAH